MAEIVERFEEKARFEDESEAELIREKLEQFVTNILAEVEKRDKRFQSTLIESGSVYEGTKVCQPDEFDFMIRIDSLTDKPLFRPCDKGEGYAKLFLDEQEWEEFKDDEGFFNPHMLSRFFKKLVNASLGDAELPEGLAFQQVREEMYGTWWPVYSEILGNAGGQESSSVMYSETHGPATTLRIYWQGGKSYRNLAVSVDLTLTLDYQESKLPIELTKLSQNVNPILQKCGFHVVPAGFDSWRISFSMAEKEILASSPDGFKTCYRVLKVMRDEISESVGWDSSLIPSYMLKTVLLSELFQTNRDSWDEDVEQRTFQALELSLQGVEKETISSFFIARQNLLTEADHENKLRQYVLKDMLYQMKGSKLAHTPEDAREKKQQIRVLQMIDLEDYIISGLFAGKKQPTALWNKMFENIGNVPFGTGDEAKFMSQLTDLNTTELDEDAYRWLIQIWNTLEDFFKKLLNTLEGELNLIAHKFYIRTCDKKNKFESENKKLSEEEVEQIPPRDFVSGWFDECVDFYTERENSTVPNIRKAVPHEFIPSGLLQGIADVTVKQENSNIQCHSSTQQ
ncbi:cyclic GMP-AMP synthase-like receptor [Montipora capricornis]|uniref:cyclic GMP-AMP synthase-like receptor n=1 Tax=Montipora capricornis TaxID=246305 RepID=UPI0035F1BE29